MLLGVAGQVTGALACQRPRVWPVICCTQGLVRLRLTASARSSHQPRDDGLRHLQEIKLSERWHDDDDEAKRAVERSGARAYCRQRHHPTVVEAAAGGGGRGE
jgi:hypothetical protein